MVKNYPLTRLNKLLSHTWINNLLKYILISKNYIQCNCKWGHFSNTYRVTTYIILLTSLQEEQIHVGLNQGILRKDRYDKKAEGFDIF